MLLVILASYQLVLKELEVGGGAPLPSPPQHHQDLNSMSSNLDMSSSRSVSTTSPAGSGDGMRFTALHVTMIFIAILLCVVICAIPWDNFKCRNNTSNNNTTTTSTINPELQTNPDEEEARQLGLSRNMIKSFQVVRYGASSLRDKAEQLQHEEGVGGGGGGSCWSECMICLSDFRNGQMVRILPHCNHGFHKKCIDQWLLSHTSCPICRNVLLVLDVTEKSTPTTRHLDNVDHVDHVDVVDHEDQSQTRAAADPPASDVGEALNDDEETPPLPPPPPPPPPPVSAANHQDYYYHQSVYTTYIVISD